MLNNKTRYVINDLERKISQDLWSAGQILPEISELAQEYETDNETICLSIIIMISHGFLQLDSNDAIRVSESMTTDSINFVNNSRKNNIFIDNQIVQMYLHNCVSIITEHAEDNDNKILEDDNRAIQLCVCELKKYGFTMMDYGDMSDDSRSDAIIENMLYDKGLKCAGWSTEKYTLYQCNLSDNSCNYIRGKLLSFEFASNTVEFDDRTKEYVEQRVHSNDILKYISIMNQQYITEMVERGEHTVTFDYRENRGTAVRWVRVILEVSKSTLDDDISLFMLFLDIDEEKKLELTQKEMTDEDALTGMLNRRAFILQSEKLLTGRDKNSRHAFMMIDIDGFKNINDLFGHPTGDSVLCDISSIMRSVLRQGDLLGRLGGDEFMICLKNIPDKSIIEKRADQIRKLMYRDFEKDVHISGSIGVTIYPQDGTSFDELYKKADIALYNAKENGKDRVEFYDAEMSRNSEIEPVASEAQPVTYTELLENKKTLEADYDETLLKRKILVVDDIKLNREILADMLKDDFRVVTAKDGRTAMMTLRRYGAGISAVLLDLGMPIMDGFEVLREIQEIPILRAIPVIVVSGEEHNEFKAIEMGAVDFVTKPVDKRVINLRVVNAVNKYENDRLRAQNSYLQIQSEEEARYRHIVQSTGTIVIEHDWVNSIFRYDKAISDYLVGKYDGRSFWGILLSDMVASSLDVKEMQKTVYNLANEKNKSTATLKIRLRTVEGEKHWFKMSVLKTTDNLNLTNKLIITLNDINDEVIGEEKLRYLAEYDSLTRIFNRTTFLERADEILKTVENNKWVLSVLDIDGFKVFNHLYGHNAGDTLLEYVGEHLQKAAEKVSGVCGRIHADTFVIMHPLGSVVIEDLLNAINYKLIQNSMDKKISLTVGRCLVEDVNCAVNAILDRAVIAHKIAKEGTCKDVFFTPDMQKKLFFEEEILASMEEALLTRQFELYFQPIINYDSNRIITVEALVRWNHPERGIIEPNDFIPLFEQNGFILNLDLYVWEEACKRLREWIDQGYNPIPISVNVSRIDVYSEDIVSKITSITNKYRIPPELLRFEITESAYMRNSEQMINVVNRLRNLGFIIEMDDFGSGFSSLNTLSEMPVDVLKLDMRFVSGANCTGRKEIIMGHVINMAKSTDIDVIAEGVETREQAELLKRLGCVVMQGFYFSKPVPVLELGEILAMNKGNMGV